MSEGQKEIEKEKQRTAERRKDQRKRNKNKEERGLLIKRCESALGLYILLLSLAESSFEIQVTSKEQPQR